jgi:hypothetical protein
LRNHSRCAPQEKKLLDASKAFDKAIQDRDRSAIDALFAAEVTVHKGTHAHPFAGLRDMI